MGATLAAIGLAAFSVSPAWQRHFRQSRAAGAVDFIRSLHSGKVGDYVAYFAFGVAALTISFAVILA